MNWLSVSGQKTDLEFKPEAKNYKLQFLSLSVRHDQTFS